MLKYLVRSLVLIVTAVLVFSSAGKAQLSDDSLKIDFMGDAKIEVGGPYVGIELHHSSPILQRISFFYPVANSLDESTDYWKRDTSFIMTLGLKIGDGPKEIIGREPYEFTLTPYSILYHKEDADKSIAISYSFTGSKPAMVINYEIKNKRKEHTAFEFYTGLETALRTSHSFNFIDKAWTESDSSSRIIYTNYDDPQTGNAQIFIVNAGVKPASFSTGSSLTGITNPDDDWLTEDNLNNELISRDNQQRPAAKFLYRKTLGPGETMKVIQIIGMCRQDEGKEIAAYLGGNYQKDVNDYEQSVLKKVYKDAEITSGDPVIDRSVSWAKAILEVNKHYIDGEFVPMPCPAEYNFYFTHDVLMTDLAAVNFDTARVKRDLSFIIRHANEDKIIPHAYYWKDSAFTTEFASHDNWNNFWLIIVSGTYLRHSGDTSFVRTLYPYIEKSLKQALMTKGDDDLMWSGRPDWWDIGQIYGQRTYMTVLAIKAIREYLFLSSVLGNNTEKLNDYEKLSGRMQQQLNDKLWDDSLKYLINFYEPGKEDQHYYIGSLLAAHYGLLDMKRISALTETAGKKLLDEKVGIYNVFPMDFDKLRDYFKFAGNEAGDPFLYANGGIWPHGNAWYALALMAEGKKDEAFSFIKNIMTVDGVMAGPNGQPAMYEVRDGNYNDPAAYGTVDKPQFLWAAGWYLYSLYHLYAVNENAWNISLDPYIPANSDPVILDLYNAGKLTKVKITGSGGNIKKIVYDGKEIPSAVIPFDGKYGRIDVEAGTPVSPYLQSSESRLEDARYNSSAGTLDLNLKSFPGHTDTVVVVSPREPSEIFLDGQPYADQSVNETAAGIKIIKLGFIYKAASAELKLVFK